MYFLYKTNLHLLWCVIYWCPVRNSTHSHFTISKLLTESSILGLWMSTSVSVMKGNIEEKWPLFSFCIVFITFIVFFLLSSLKSFLFMGLEKLADQELNASDVPPNLEDRAVFFCVGKIKRVNISRTDMLLPNYTCSNSKREKLL